MPVGQGARNNIVLGGLGRPNLFDTNVKATSIDEDIFSDQTEVTAAEDADLVLVLDTSETPDKIKFITKANFIGEGLVAINNNVDNRILTGTGSAVNGEANLLFDGTILTNDGGEVNVDIASGDPHLSFQIGGTDKFTIGVDDDDSDTLKIDTGGTVGGGTILSLTSGGVLDVDGGITVDNITIDGTEIDLSSGDLTLDVEGDIILDANGANITFRDNGTDILDIANSSTDVEITLSTADKNLKFKGTDGSSAITALDIDMAAAGAATFNSDVVVGGLLKMPSNTASKILVADGSSFEEVAIGDLAEISSIENDDVFIAIDTSGGGLKKVSRSQVVSGLAASGAITDIVDDTTPQLGGNLDMNGNDIVTTSNANIDLAPNGTGTVVIRGNSTQGTLTLNCENNSHGQKIKAAPHSESASNTLTLPSTGGDSRLVSAASTATLTNKTLTTPKIAEIDSLSSGNIVLDAEANIEINADGGTITFKDDSASLGTITSSGYSGTAAVATVATTVTITDNESTDEDNAIVFTAGGDIDGGNLGLESDGTMTYNPSTGKITATGFIGALTGNADTATALATGRTIGMTGDVVWTSASFTGAGNVTGSSTIQADAVESGMLNDNIISGQTEITTGLADADELLYSDGGVLKRVGLDTLSTKILTGNAASATILATARAINGVDFDGSAAITVPAAGSTLSDTVPVSKGGTNATSLADKAVLITQDSGTDTVSAAAMSTNGQLLIGGTSGPAVSTLTAGSNVTITNADGGITIAAAGGSNTMGDGFVLEDGDGTEVTITENKEVKFVEGGGIDINFTDTDNGTDADPFDLTFTINAAQTGITSIHATDLIIGEDAETAIDFGTINEIDFKVDNANRLTLDTGALYPATNNQIDLGTSSLEFKDAFFDGTVTADAFAGPLTGNADTATLATTVTITDNESTDEDNAIIFTAGGDVDGGNLGLESDGTLTYNPSTGKITATGFVGALTGNADTATLATTVTITDNENTNEDNAVIFTAGGDVDGGNLGLESDGNLTYNPSTGRLTATQLAGTLQTAAQANITSVGTLSGLTIADGGNIGSASDTNAIGISSGGVISITATTANTDASDGALTVAGGASVAADFTVGDDLRLLSDSAVLSFGADGESTITHANDAGLTFNSKTTFDEVVVAADKDITMGASSRLVFGTDVPNTDHEATGVIVKITSSGTLARGVPVYIDGSGTVAAADASAVGTMPAIGINTTDLSGGAGEAEILISGIFRDDNYAFTAGADVFVGTDPTTTAGTNYLGITTTAPSGSGDTVQKIGVALTADTVFFNFNTAEVLLA